MFFIGGSKMGRQKEAFKKMHPLISKRLDKAFEDFCRHIAEAEILLKIKVQKITI